MPFSDSIRFQEKWVWNFFFCKWPRMMYLVLIWSVMRFLGPQISLAASKSPNIYNFSQKFQIARNDLSFWQSDSLKFLGHFMTKYELSALKNECFRALFHQKISNHSEWLTFLAKWLTQVFRAIHGKIWALCTQKWMF